MEKIIRVYVAGPLMGSGNPLHNVTRAVSAGAYLQRAGYAPYVPHVNVLADMMIPRSAEAWLSLDREWLIVCNAMVRLPGVSPGTEKEVAWCCELGIPVFSVAPYPNTGLDLPDLVARLDCHFGRSSPPI